MRRILRISLFCLLAPVVFNISGCGSSSTEPEFVSKLVPVTGKVTLDGNPLTGVMINYLPAEGQPGGEIAFGLTDETGTYTLQTQLAGQSPEDSQGALPGNYSIYIHKLVLPDGSAVPEGLSDAEAEEKGAKQLLPAQYSSPTASKLTAVVNSEATTNDFTLKK
ncbi:hypothetical protein [Gimesia algae]|nr:hypothetical protein [Gimesia algae]